MEPRARAGKNVGKMTFNHTELSQLLVGHGDVLPPGQPLPETVRLLDELATDFIQSVSFEATRTAHHAGRQKVKFEDFEFAMRKNPVMMGKIRETFEKKRQIDAARNIINEDEMLIKEQNKAEKKAARAAARVAAKAGASGGGAGAAEKNEEELGEADDDAQAEADALGTSSSKRRRLE